jgi:hypothetical protein
MTSVETIAKPIARAINIYCSVARHDLDMPTKRGLARHIKQLADEGVQLSPQPGTSEAGPRHALAVGRVNPTPLTR